MNIRKINIFMLFLVLIVSSCSKQETKEAAEIKTGLELIAIGSINFGGVQLGQFRDAAIEAKNYGPGNIVDIQAEVQAPFSIQSISEPCNTGTLPAGQSCQIVVRFEPPNAEAYSSDVLIGGKIVKTQGLGLLDGSFVLYEEDGETSLSGWDLGNQLAGTPIRKLAVLKNLGDIALPINLGQINLPVGVILTTSSCRSILVGGASCNLEFLIEKQKSGNIVEEIGLSNFVFNKQNLFIGLTTSVTPREPSGLIAFETFNRIMIADAEQVQTITSLPIRDQFSNIVADNTPIALNAIGLEIVGGTLVEENNPSGFGTRFVSSGSAVTTNGKVSFQIRTTKKKGSFGFYTISGDANGYGDVKLISGPASGIITIKDTPTQIIANGQQSVRLDLDPLFDKNNNLVENGTQVFFTLLGEGTLDTSSRTTIAGQTSVVLTSPTNVGFADVLIQSGAITNSSGVITGYTAEGTFRINYIPGPAFGVIPISVSKNSIYADPSDSFTISENGFPDRSSIQVGPIFDQFDNLVNFGTQVKVWVRNGVNFTQPQSGEDSPSVFQTNENGQVTFSVKGDGDRGNIEIYIQSGSAEGLKNVWAYKKTILQFNNTDKNPLTLFQKYSKNDPSPDLRWGKAYDYGVLAFKNNSYWGFKKRNGLPLQENEPYPYYMSDCFFPLDEYLYTYPCKGLSGKYENSRQIDAGFTSTNRFMRKPIAQAHYILPLSQDIPDTSVTYCSELIDLNDCESTTTIRGLNCEWDGDYPDGVCKELHKNECTPIENSVDCEDFSSIGARTCHWEPISGTSIGICKADPNIKYPLMGFLPNANKMMIYGGYTEIIEEESSFGFVSSLSTFYTDVLSTGTMNVYNITGNEDFEIGSKPGSLSLTGVASSDDRLWIYGGMQSYPGDSAAASESFFEYDNISDLWYSITVNGDPDLVDTPLGGSPSSRYGNATYYIDEVDTLYMFGGLVQDQSNTTLWRNTNDFWKIDMSPRKEDLSAELVWNNICRNCGFPLLDNDLITFNRLGENGNGALNDLPYNEARFLEAEKSVQLAKMVWDDIRQVAYLYWQDESLVYKFDPFTDTMSLMNEGDGGINNLRGMRDIIYNKKVGRTFAYERIATGSVEAFQSRMGELSSKIWTWDSDNEEKTFYKAVFNVGEGSKDFVQGLKPIVYGYGSSKTADENTALCLSGLSNSDDKSVCYFEVNTGLKVSIFNDETKLYELVGENLDENITFDNPDPAVIQNTLTRETNPNISDYISPEGEVILLITARGTPGHESSLGLSGLPQDFNCYNYIDPISGDEKSLCGKKTSTSDACYDRFFDTGRQSQLTNIRQVKTKNAQPAGFTPFGGYTETVVVDKFTDKLSFGTNFIPQNVINGVTQSTFTVPVVANKPYQINVSINNMGIIVKEQNNIEILNIDNTDTDNPTVINENIIPTTSQLIFTLNDNGSNSSWNNLTLKETNPSLAGLSKEISCQAGFAAQACQIDQNGTIDTSGNFQINNITDGCQVEVDKCTNFSCENIVVTYSCEDPSASEVIDDCYESPDFNNNNSSIQISGEHTIKLDHIRIEGTF